MLLERYISGAVRFFRIVNAFHACRSQILQWVRIVVVVDLVSRDLIACCFSMIVGGSIARSYMRPSFRVYIQGVFFLVVWYFW